MVKMINIKYFLLVFLLFLFVRCYANKKENFFMPKSDTVKDLPKSLGPYNWDLPLELNLLKKKLGTDNILEIKENIPIVFNNITFKDSSSFFVKSTKISFFNNIKSSVRIYFFSGRIIAFSFFPNNGSYKEMKDLFDKSKKKIVRNVGKYRKRILMPEDYYEVSKKSESVIWEFNDYKIYLDLLGEINDHKNRYDWYLSLDVVINLKK